MANKPRISGSCCGLLDWLLDKLIAEGFGCGGEAGEALALEPGFVGARAYIDVVLSVVQHAIDQGCQLPRDGEDGHQVALVTRRAAEGGTQRAVRPLQRDGRHAQDGRDTDGAGAVGLLAGQGLAPGDGGSRGQAQPADEVLFGGEGGQVKADFGEDGLRRAGTDAVDAGEIDPGEAPQDGPDLLQQACLVGSDPFLDVVVQLQRGLKVEQMLLAPGAREIFGEVRLGFPGPLDCHSCHSPNSPKLRRYSTPITTDGFGAYRSCDRRQTVRPRLLCHAYQAVRVEQDRGEALQPGRLHRLQEESYPRQS